MKRVTYSMGMTADGFVVGPDGRFDWGAGNALPKVVFSRTLTSVATRNTTLATAALGDEIERLRAEPGQGEIAIGGATLAASAAELGLIDEYRVRVSPVLVGGGVPFFARIERRVDLELLSTRTFRTGAVALRYGVRR
jgi:dihydrofolate reductase